jgi:hypothetical protein
MSAPVITLDPVRLACVDLQPAHLCQDCNGITAAPNGRCARCGSQSLLSLAGVLNRVSDPAPVHPVECRISIGGEEWSYVQEMMRKLAQEAQERDPATFQMFGACGFGGSYAVTTKKCDVSPEQYRAELQAWRERQLPERKAV